MKKGHFLVWPVAGPQRHSSRDDQRFQHKGGIVRDQHTSLSWLRTIPAAPFTWQEALHALKGLNQRPNGSTSNWRLPNIRELESLVDLNCLSPALQAGHPFAAIHTGYRCSTNSVDEPRYAWVLYLQDGAVGVGFRQEPTFGIWAASEGEMPHKSGY